MLYFVGACVYETIKLPGIRLAIQRTINTDSTTSFVLTSEWTGQPAGLIITIPRVDSHHPASSGWIKTLGAPSDLLLQVFADQYKLSLKANSHFVDSLPFTILNLGKIFKDSTSADPQIAADYKLFFESEGVAGDAELFLNIDAGNQWIGFSEKDQDYREHLMKLFTKH